MVAYTPAEVDRLFAVAISTGDLEGALDLYEEDAVYIDGHGTHARGRAEIREALAELIAENGKLDCYEIEAVEQGDTAMLRARWTYTGTRPDGTTYDTQGWSIEVLRRQPDGSWRFTIDLPAGTSQSRD